MSETIRSSIAGAEFLAWPGLLALANTVAVGGDGIRVVGGAVRSTIVGRPVSDVDLATTALPETVTSRARAAGFAVHPTGMEHGTVTVVAEGRAFEVTTLRADVATDGRRATVAFTRDWAADAMRRDFTVNAIYADLDGDLYDPVGGIADALARQVRFIGDPAARLAEDYLRILRFFRFHAVFGALHINEAGLAACIAARRGLDQLSRERIGQEMRKLLLGFRGGETLEIMQESGIAGPVLAGVVRPATLAALGRLTRRLDVDLTLPLALAGGCAFTEADADRLRDRLRLPGREVEEAAAILAASRRLGPEPSVRIIRAEVYRHGNAATLNGLLLAAAIAGLDPDPAIVAAAREFQAPTFPLGGRDLIAAGMVPGPDLGARLAALEADWIASDFTVVPESLSAAAAGALGK